MQLPSIDHPTDRPNFARVTIGDLTLWFSYETCVGFMAPGRGCVVRENRWGPTTGKHLDYIDDGPRRRQPRVDGATFERELADVLAGVTA